MSELKAVGVHVFAGGFTAGVQAAGWRVDEQLEVHGFALDTARKMCGVETINCPADEWPRKEGVMSFGNPRCTAFSTLTSGDRYVESNAHGPFAKQTCDIVQLCEYSAGNFDFVVWESVQQAFTGQGSELVQHVIDKYFAPRHYRIAHLLINAGTFANAQQRKRYFFVAYRDSYQFNIAPPVCTPHYTTLYDAIYDMRDRPTSEVDLSADDAVYDADCWHRLSENDKATLPYLPNGWSKNTLGKFGYPFLTERDQTTWDFRSSDLPFSLHGVARVTWCRPSPTLHSSACRWIHPDLDRGLTVGEASAIMGWPTVPVGPKPFAQIAKGIVPAIGSWLADQVRLSYTGHWGKDDWESSFDSKTGRWVGGDANGKLEKVYDMTEYCGKHFNEERHERVLIPRFRLNVCPHTGQLVHPWKELAEQSSWAGQRGAGRILRHLTEPDAELLAELKACP